MRTGRLTHVVMRKAGSPLAASFFTVDMEMKLKACSPQPRLTATRSTPCFGHTPHILAWDGHPWPPRQIRNVGLPAPARAKPSASNPCRVAFPSGADCVALPAPIAGALRVASPRPRINECACARPPRGSLSHPGRTILPTRGSPWLVTCWGSRSLPLRLHGVPPRAFSLPSDSWYSGQQVSCRSGRLRDESEQGPARRRCGTDGAGDEALRCACLSQLGQRGWSDTQLLPVVLECSSPHAQGTDIRIPCWHGCVSQGRTSPGTGGQTAAKTSPRPRPPRC